MIEISDSTLIYDQTVKLQLYAEAGIHHYWIFNLKAQRLEQYADPYRNAQGEFDYLSRQFSLPHQQVSIPGMGGLGWL